MRKLGSSEEMGPLASVLEIMHTHEKENMRVGRDGVMSFDIEGMHRSTYMRICKALGLPLEKGLIE